MNPRNWKNKYIDLLVTKPEYIIPGTNTGLTAEQIRLIRARSASYSEVYCELGSGSGMHLISCAERNPRAFYIGFELRFKRTFRTAEKAERLSLNNLIIVRSKAESIAEVFGRGSLSGVYINFPDPWDKKKWLKHRMLNPEMIRTLHDLLTPNGFLSYKTDHKEYFNATENLLSNENLFSVCSKTENLYQSHYLADNIPSEFENLFCSKGQPIYWLQARPLA